VERDGAQLRRAKDFIFASRSFVLGLSVCAIPFTSGAGCSTGGTACTGG
jgi:hypothetical protein